MKVQSLSFTPVLLCLFLVMGSLVKNVNQCPTPFRGKSGLHKPASRIALCSGRRLTYNTAQGPCSDGEWELCRPASVCRLTYTFLSLVSSLEFLAVKLASFKNNDFGTSIELAEKLQEWNEELCTFHPSPLAPVMCLLAESKSGSCDLVSLVLEWVLGR